jgi:hypothetical protein
MNGFLLSFLLLTTIVAAFAFGIAAGYWAIVGLLHMFHPARKEQRASRAVTLAPTTSGD